VPENGSACRAEAEHLLELGAMLPVDEGPWKTWRAEVEALLADSGLESLAGEQRLDELAGRLRELWLTHAHTYSDRHFRSPVLASTLPRLPSGEPVAYSYERNVQADALERRIAEGNPPPPGWCAAHVSYANGMAAMTNLLQTFLNMVRPSSSDPLRLGIWGSYFETEVLLELLRGETFQPRQITDQDELRQAVRDGMVDALFIEPVRYDWEMATLDLTALLQAWRQRRARRPNVLIVDTTLVSTTWPTGQLLAALTAQPSGMVVELRSGLKLDQQGLELANVGVVSVVTAPSAEPTASEIATVLRKMRTVTGSGLSMDSLAALDAPFALARMWTDRHAQAVFLNNALLAITLARRPGLFSRIAHPALANETRPPWGQGPFVVCHLAEDTLDNHGLLVAVVEFEARQRGLCLSRGSSFGFRGHRFETIIPRLKDHRGLFKIAMGGRSGPSRDGTIELFTRIAAFPDFAALRAAYPHVTPVDLTDLEP
jgi:hypothetical protein